MKTLNILSLGAGVQSSTLALRAQAGLVEPMPDAAVFADTMAEPKSVYDWLGYLEQKLRFPVHRVSNGSLEEAGLTIFTTKSGFKYSRSDIPFFTRNPDQSEGQIRQRGCTRDFKINPIIAKLRELAGKEAFREWRRRHKPALAKLSAWQKEAMAARKANKDRKEGQPRVHEPMRPAWAWDECQADALVVQWIGISLDEVGRMKESREPWIKNRWPLIDQRMNRNDCLQWMQAQGHPRPPRSACTFCPFHNDDEWRRLRDEEPEAFAHAIEFERKVQAAKAGPQNTMRAIPFLHRSLVTLDKVDFSTDYDRGQGNLFNNECEGMCGV